VDGAAAAGFRLRLDPVVEPGQRVLNHVLKAMFGLAEPPLTPYGMLPLIVISGLGLTPTAFVMLSGLLRNMDPLLEDAGVASAPRAGR
jgi:ABC-type Fe3+ transport system permease subunit